jgi:hypothetical protein
MPGRPLPQGSMGCSGRAGRAWAVAEIALARSAGPPACRCGVKGTLGRRDTQCDAGVGSPAAPLAAADCIPAACLRFVDRRVG